jgi:hypothetical protein
VTSVRPLSPSARLLTSVAAVAALGLGGCAGTGVDAQTNAQYQAGVGANVRTGSIQLFNALAVDNDNGTATLSAAVLNTTNKSVKLVDVDVEPLEESGVGGWPLIVGPGQLKDIGKSGTVVIDSKSLKAGDYVRVKLTFSGKNSVSVDAPVVARTPMYDSVATSGGGEEVAPVKTADEPGL